MPTLGNRRGTENVSPRTEATSSAVMNAWPATPRPAPAEAPYAGRRPKAFWRDLLAYVPQGRALPAAMWQRRHRGILVVLAAHAVGLAAFGMARGYGVAHSALEGAAIAGLAAAAAWDRIPRRGRSVLASLGLVSSSAVLTHLSGGYIEAHFHFFVMLGVIALYQDWVTFLASIGFVALHHGVVGTLDPESVFNHAAAIESPWKWASIHALFVLALAAALSVLWRETEEARLRTEMVLDSAGDGILGLDEVGRVTFANPAMAALTGLPLERLVGSPVGDLFGEPGGAAAPGWPAPARPILDGTIHQDADSALRDAGGDLVPVEWISTPIRRHGQPVGAVVAVRGTTERRRAEAERVRHVEQRKELEHLRALDGFKTRFLNAAAHELSTPLTPVRLQLHILRAHHDPPLAPSQQARSLEILERNVDRLRGLVHELLDAARLQDGRFALKRSPLDLHALLVDAVESYRDVAGEAGVVLDLASRPGLWVEADAKRLAQVVDNLLDNAVKFTPRGGRVTLEAGAEGGRARVRVRDTGVGIPADRMAQLFAPFSQVHDMMERTAQGSGLGLYICKGIVELHGGRIACESEGRDRGATFWFEIPLQPAYALEASAPVAVAAP